MYYNISRVPARNWRRIAEELRKATATRCLEAGRMALPCRGCTCQVCQCHGRNRPIKHLLQLPGSFLILPDSWDHQGIFRYIMTMNQFEIWHLICMHNGRLLIKCTLKLMLGLGTVACMCSEEHRMLSIILSEKLCSYNNLPGPLPTVLNNFCLEPNFVYMFPITMCRVFWCHGGDVPYVII
jgi:hypothetical protein